MGLATGLESAQPIATAITPLGTQIPTPRTPQPLVIQIAAPSATPIAVPLTTPIAAPAAPTTLPGSPPAQYLHPSTTNTDPAITPLGTQIPTPRIP
jgi:hypothetical protein